MNSEVSLESARSYLDHLDLGYIIDAMCSPLYPLPRWIKSEAECCEQMYKNFLWLQKKYSRHLLVPTRQIDEFWHNHILYTKKYSEDCLAIFGYYLHHEPADPTEQPQLLTKAYTQTKTLYQTEFGTPMSLL